MKDEIWSVEYDSKSENILDLRSWHVGKLQRSLLSNYDNLLQGRIDCYKWVIVATANNLQSAEQLRDIFMKELFDEYNEEN